MSSMSKTDLINKCKELGIKNYSSKNKAQLQELINTNTKYDNKYFLEYYKCPKNLIDNGIKADFTMGYASSQQTNQTWVARILRTEQDGVCRSGRRERLCWKRLCWKRLR